MINKIVIAFIFFVGGVFHSDIFAQKRKGSSTLLVNCNIHSHGLYLPNHHILTYEGNIYEIIPPKSDEFDDINNYKYEKSLFWKYNVDSIINMKNAHVYPTGIIAYGQIPIPNKYLKKKKEGFDPFYFPIAFPNIMSSDLELNQKKDVLTALNYGAASVHYIPFHKELSMHGFGSLVELNYKVGEALHIFKKDWTLFIEWPNFVTYNKTNDIYHRKANLLEDLIKYSFTYNTVSRPEDINFRYEYIIPIFSRHRKNPIVKIDTLEKKKEVKPETEEDHGKKYKSLFIRADYHKELIDAIALKKKYDIERLIIYGGYHAQYHIPEIKASGVKLIFRPLNSITPLNEIFIYADGIKAVYDAKIPCAISSGELEEYNEFASPTYGFQLLKSSGLQDEQIINLYTLDIAKIFGVSSKIGSIRERLHATFFGYAKPMGKIDKQIPNFIMLRGKVIYNNIK